MSTSLNKGACRARARKLLKACGLDSEIRISNNESMLEADELGIVTAKREGQYLPYNRIEYALAKSDLRCKAIHDEMAVLVKREGGAA